MTYPSRRRSLGAMALMAACLACSSRGVDSAAGSHPSGAAKPNGARVAFAITYPRTGDTLIEGHTYVLRWRAPDTMTINLGAAMGGHDKGLLLDHAPSAPDTLVWTIPVGYVTGFGPASSDMMRLRLENAANPDQYAEVGPFTITGTPK